MNDCKIESHKGRVARLEGAPARPQRMVEGGRVFSEDGRGRKPGQDPSYAREEKD